MVGALLFLVASLRGVFKAAEARQASALVTAE